MQSRDDGLSRDERDAVSAEELLKRLKNEMESKSGVETDDNQALPKENTRISEEVSKNAHDGIMHGNPDEFGDNLETLMRMVMNMPADDSSEPDITGTEDSGRTEAGNEDCGGVTSDAEQTDFAAETAETAEQDTDNHIFCVEDNEDDLQITHPHMNGESDKKYDEISSDTKDSEDNEDTGGFLSGVAKIIHEHKDDPSEADSEFEFVSDIPEEETEAAEPDVMPEEDGGREYTQINGSDFNSTEISLLSLFGDREKLEETYGKDKADEIIESGSKPIVRNIPVKKKFYELFPSDYEYTSYEQNDEIKSRYIKAFRYTAVRLAFCLIFAGILFVIENMNLLSITPANMLNIQIYPILYAMVDLQLVFLCALMAYDKIAYGLVSLVKLKPVPESILCVLFASSVVYTWLITTSDAIRTATFYNFPVALVFLVSLVCSLMDIKREIMGFTVVSAGRKRYAVRRLNEKERSEDAQLFEQYVPDDSPMFAVVKTGFVDGFFSHIRRTYKKSRFIGILLIISMAEIMLAVAFGMFMKSDIYTIATVSYITLILGLSGTVLIAQSYPFYRASKSAFENESAVLGEKSLSEYSDGSVVFFDDKDIFPSTGVKINSVKVYGDNRIDKVIYNAASIFSKTGGPLQDVFNLATIEIGHSEDVIINENDENGIYCSIDGSGLYLGTNDYMKSKGFETPYAEGDENLEKNGVRLMYMADENEILAKFNIKYTVDSEYELIFKQLYKAGMCIGVRTNDPNIDNAFVLKKLRLKDDYPVRVVHVGMEREIVRRSEREESGVVSAGSVKSLLRALSLCDRIKYVSKIHNMFLTVSAVIAIILVYIVTAFGKLGFGSAYAVLYQIFWLIPMMLVTMFTE